MEKTITYSDKQVKVACDEKCEKAWGIVARATIYQMGQEYIKKVKKKKMKFQRLARCFKKL